MPGAAPHASYLLHLTAVSASRRQWSFRGFVEGVVQSRAAAVVVDPLLLDRGSSLAWSLLPAMASARREKRLVLLATAASTSSFDMAGLVRSGR